MSIVRNLKSLRESPHHLRMLALFVVTSFVAIFATTVAFGSLLANYMTHKMTERDAVIFTQMLNSIVHVEDATGYFFGENQNLDVPEIREFFVHVARLPDVFRANVYARTGEIIWSSDPELVGRVFEDNDDLAAAFMGKINPELGILDRREKEEHVGLPDNITEFLEYYIPIWTVDKSFIVGAVEIYKSPAGLMDALARLRIMAWTGSAIAGALLFSALLMIVGYSSRILHRQEQRLVETEKLAVVGEMASAVAHGLRNPLAAIRSCAELVVDDPIPDTSKSVVVDIIDQVDRLEGWIRAFLIRNQQNSNPRESRTNVDQLVNRCIENFRSQLEKRNIQYAIVGSPENITIGASPDELEQVINSILSNAVEAMPAGGELTIDWRVNNAGRVTLYINDTGHGIPETALKTLLEPFQTSKPAGLGVGLALAHRITERLGGHLTLANSKTGGVEVSLDLPRAG